MTWSGLLSHGSREDPVGLDDAHLQQFVGRDAAARVLPAREPFVDDVSHGAQVIQDTRPAAGAFLRVSVAFAVFLGGFPADRRFIERGLVVFLVSVISEGVVAFIGSGGRGLRLGGIRPEGRMLFSAQNHFRDIGDPNARVFGDPAFVANEPCDAGERRER